MYTIKIVTIILIAFISIINAVCPVPPPSVNYTDTLYQGVWYQLAKYQTLGGEIFEFGCKCTKMQISEQDGNQLNAVQSCIKNGKNSTAPSVLIPNGPAGTFVQKIFVTTVDYHVIYLDNDYAIQYDCYVQGLVTNYCIHLMSRLPTAPQSIIDNLADFAINLGLNRNNLKRQVTDQSCWKQLLSE